MHLYFLLLRGHLEFGKKKMILSKFPRYNTKVQKRVVMATMGLHNFIIISNFSDENFAEIMEQVVFDNTEDETNLGDTETGEIGD